MSDQSSEWNPRGGGRPAPPTPFDPATPPSIPPSIAPRAAGALSPEPPDGERPAPIVPAYRNAGVPERAPVAPSGPVAGAAAPVAPAGTFPATVAPPAGPSVPAVPPSAPSAARFLGAPPARPGPPSAAPAAPWQAGPSAPSAGPSAPSAAPPPGGPQWTPPAARSAAAQASAGRHPGAAPVRPAPAPGRGAPQTALERLRAGGARPTGRTAAPPQRVMRVNPALLRPASPPGARPLLAARRAINSMFVADWVAGPVVADAVRAQQPITTGRRVVVVGAHPRAGATTTTLTLGHLLAEIRREPVAVLSTDTDPAPFAVRTGVMPGHSANAIADGLAKGRLASRDELVAAMDAVGPSLSSIAWQETRTSPACAGLVSEFSRYFAASFVDGGNVLGPTTPALVARSHVTVLVAQASREGMRAAEEAFATMAAAGYVQPKRFVISLVETNRRQHLDLRWEARMVRKQGIRSVSIPFDPHLNADTQIRPDYLSTPVRQAFLEMLGDVIDSSMTKG